MTEALTSKATDPKRGKAIDLTLKLATSFLGQLAAYVAALAAALYAFKRLAEPLAGIPRWTQALIVFAPLVFVLLFNTIPVLIEWRRKKQLAEVGGKLQPGYFRLFPRDDEASFKRADGKHQEILNWLERNESHLLYLTGMSGTGKSSLLAAWVLPNLERLGAAVVHFRTFQHPAATLTNELMRPGAVWQRPPNEQLGLRPLLELAARHVSPLRLLIVMDQFEEFVILGSTKEQECFLQLLSSLQREPIAGITFLLVFRSDYIGLVEKLSLPTLVQGLNWEEVPSFTESAAQEFIRGSGLQVQDELLRQVLREAAEIEQTKGIVRPITINLCGLVLGRFAMGLPRSFGPKGLIRGFLRESISLPSIRQIAPRLLPHLITNYVTRQQRTIKELAQETQLDVAAVRGCLRVLGRSDRAIVRPLDSDQQTWEISHDFLVPLLDSIMARWTVSLWRRFRGVLPWAAAVILVVMALFPFPRPKDPSSELVELGWAVARVGGGMELEFIGDPPKQSGGVLRRLRQPLFVKIMAAKLSKESFAGWGDLDIRGIILRGSLNDISTLKYLKGPTALYLVGTQINNFSALKDYTTLMILYAPDTLVNDLSALRNFKQLMSLNINGARVSDLSPLKDLTNLSQLNLNETQVSDLSPLAGLVNLRELRLRDSKVSDLSPLRGLHNLEILDLSGTQVADVAPLTNLEGLRQVYLEGTKVADVSPLKKLANLRIFGPRSRTLYFDLPPGGRMITNPDGSLSFDSSAGEQMLPRSPRK